MPSPRSIEITLFAADKWNRRRTVTLELNEYGQLPAVLVDPLDQSGEVVPGLWLIEYTRADVEPTAYRRIG